MQWKELTEIKELDQIQNLSSEGNTIVLFKHSTRCGISSMVLKLLNRELDTSDFKNTVFYFLDLIKYREVSNAIAKKWDIEHQSPQMIILMDGKVITHASHYSINASLIPG